ncbi:MAG: uroporphyrinogen decarboxylase [Bacteroidota bacterium]|nr:uroporphyrinogen decarboxylase [Bacteroidota bacterium]
MTNDLLIKAALGQPTERTPVWMMRQAGRVLKEYRQVRDKFPDFKDFVKNPDAAAEVTIQPVDIFGVDAAIIFSDILVIPEEMGLPYEMQEKKGPWFPKSIQTNADIDKLAIAEPEQLKYVIDAIKIAKKELNNKVPLIGFAGAPWTIFAYMTEGSGSKTFSNARKWLYNNPEGSHILLDKITQSTIKYLKAQIEAGVDLVQIFDSWAGILQPDVYDQFSAKYIKTICESIVEVPTIVFAKDAYFARKTWNQTNCNVVGLDWCMDINESKTLMPNKTLQGNLDPCVLYADKAVIKLKTEQMLSAFGPSKYIANLGHGLYPDINPDNVKYFVEVVQNYRHSK